MIHYYTYDSETKNLNILNTPIRLPSGQIRIQPSAEEAALFDAYMLSAVDTPTPPDGETTVIDDYTLIDNKWVPQYRFEPIIEPEPIEPAPRVFSKLQLELVLFKAGLLSAVDQFIDSQTITNKYGQTMPLRRAYSTALTFKEDNEYFKQYLDAIKVALSIDDNVVNSILSSAIS